MRPIHSQQRSGDGQSMRRTRGFTLIELMIVIAIVAILAGMAAPSFKQIIATERIRSAASALIETLWVSRAEALKRNTDVGFLFVNAATGWNVVDSSGGPTPLLTQAAHPAVKSVTEGAGSVQFSFNGYGRLSTGKGWIQLGDDGAGIYRCVTVAATGRATVANGKCT